ncbi:hypothetical protein QBC38DRAFT_445735 [Podospora fimiseda]|uniref:Uncharacterized protein n=1 Tax=Podospora fimiseda TaxID=252190 RepID=A0AAN7BKZ2_9PEZI|nr:hypothetical protein QBC38DRAFT_445735 [Podospora fimiseda]
MQLWRWIAFFLCPSSFLGVVPQKKKTVDGALAMTRRAIFGRERPWSGGWEGHGGSLDGEGGRLGGSSRFDVLLGDAFLIHPLGQWKLPRNPSCIFVARNCWLSAVRVASNYLSSMDADEHVFPPPPPKPTIASTVGSGRHVERIGERIGYGRKIYNTTIRNPPQGHIRG